MREKNRKCIRLYKTVLAKSLPWYSEFLFASQKVVEFEERKGSEILDAFRDLKFLKGKGNMRVEMKETIKGWNVRPQTTQIDAQDVWSLSQNSVSFNVSISRSNDADDIPHVNCYQQQENSDGQERKTELCVVPSQADFFILIS